MNPNSKYSQLAALINEIVGELLAVEDDPCEGLSSIMPVGGYAIHLARDEFEPGKGQTLFQFAVLCGEQEIESISSINLAHHEDRDIWERWIQSDDDFFPDALREIATRLEMDLHCLEQVEAWRAIADIKTLLNIYREKNGLQ